MDKEVLPISFKIVTNSKLKYPAMMKCLSKLS